MGERPAGVRAVARAHAGRLLPRDARDQLRRYVTAGALVAAVYIGLTLVLSGPAHLPIQGSIPIAYAAALCLHFSLQRWFVFRDAEAFALAVHHQVGRYLILALLQYGIAAAATATIPGALHIAERAVYTLAAAAMSGISFLLLRTRVFHPPTG